MGLFDALFPKSKQKKQSDGFFQLLNGYTPTFTSWSGELYENDLVRSAIDATARHVMKLQVNFKGSAQKILQNKMKYRPNRLQTWSQFLYRVSTILDMQNTCFLLPEYDEYMQRTGIITFLPSKYDLLNVDGEPWIRFYFSTGQTTAEELRNIGILTRFQYESDLFGSKNTALNQTMQLIDIQNQVTGEVAKNSAYYRFMAKLNNFSKGEALKKEREEFAKMNLASGSGSGGILLFPNTYTEIKQLQQQTYAVNPAEREAIQANVNRYFGVNKDILENSANGDQLDAFYNGKIEPFQIMLSEVLTRWMYSMNERAHGAEVIVSANRLQYMTTTAKISLVKEVGALGGLKVNEIRALFNFDALPEEMGEKVPIRGEYYFLGEERPAGRISTSASADDGGTE